MDVGSPSGCPTHCPEKKQVRPGRSDIGHCRGERGGMSRIMVDDSYEMGMVGLGVMGRNLALNMADKGFSVAGYDVDGQKVDALDRESGGHGALGTRSAKELVSALRKPRAIMMMVPAGAPVDAAIAGLLPYVEPGDILIDGGNSHFIETDGRSRTLGEKGILYLGVGISGGERGARLGPSIMPGGAEEGYAHVRPIFEAIAGKVWMGRRVPHIWDPVLPAIT